jgi:hypothetical protein
VELERVGDPEDPLLGGNVSFICRTVNTPSHVQSPALKWFYENKETKAMQLIDESNPPPGLKTIFSILYN